MPAINDDFSVSPNSASPKVSFGWIGEALALYRANLGLWLAAALLAGFAPLLFTSMVLVMAHAPAKLMHSAGLPHPSGLLLGLLILNALYSAYISAGIYGMALKQVRGQTLAFGDIFASPAIVPMLGLLLIYTILVNLGLMLFVIPGVFIAGLLLPTFALVADGVKLGDAIKTSVQAMMRDKVSAAGFIFVLGLLVYVSALPMGIGLLVTLPLWWLISALAYRDMIGLPEVHAARPLPTDGLPDSLAPGKKPTYSSGEPRRSLTGEMIDESGNPIREPVAPGPVE